MTSDKQIFSFSLANPSPKRIDLSLNAKKVDTPPTDPTHTRRILQVNICYQPYLITKEFNRIEKSLTMRTNMYTEKFHKRSEEIQAQQQLLLQKVAHYFPIFLVHKLLVLQNKLEATLSSISNSNTQLLHAELVQTFTQDILVCNLCCDG